MEIFTVAALASLVVKAMSTVKSVGKDWNAVLTQVVVWAMGIAVVALANHADAFSTLTLAGDRTFGSLDGPSIILAGAAFGSAAAVVYDFRKSIDGTDSAAEPPLVARLSSSPTATAWKPPTEP